MEAEEEKQDSLSSAMRRGSPGFGIFCEVRDEGEAPGSAGARKGCL